MTVQEAKVQYVGFGQYAGMMLGEIARGGTGRAYLTKIKDWEALLPDTREAIALVLEEYKNEQASK